MEFSDFELIQGIKRGQTSAMELLVHRWYPRIFRYVFKLTGHEQDSYDLTQDVFVAVLQNINRYYLWKKFDSWIFTIAHNKCMDYFRMQKRTALTDITELQIEESTPLLEESMACSVAVGDALKQLSDVQREVIVLYYFQQLTASEISQATHTPLPTIKSRLAAAKKLLSKYLREDFR